jgi:hypothetical protein
VLGFGRTACTVAVAVACRTGKVRAGFHCSEGIFPYCFCRTASKWVKRCCDIS